MVMGGSFNPPTVAHFKLMKAALDAVQGTQGIFVPTAHSYVFRKMARQKSRQDTLSETIRLEMLDSFCRKDKRLSVNKYQMQGDGRSYDYEMLLDLQAAHPDAEIYFLTGSDKLSILPRWRTIEKLLAQFRILVARRGEDNWDEIRKGNSFLSSHWNRFSVFEIPAEIRDISSSVFRERIHNGDESAKELVTPEGWEILHKNGKIPWESITDFHEDDYCFLSNFYEASIEYGGLIFGSNEAAFQAQKCLKQEEKAQFVNYSPGKSKNVGRHVTLRPDWEDVKIGIMEKIVRAKFTQHPELDAKLLATGNKILVEGNRWGDTFWGVSSESGEGCNHLGRILMKIRTELRG